ncbi:glutamine--scyllo-inositol aminotransferase [Chryseobacterium sp. HMWF028]|nr:glutamine--scyllo-inositol aminotransferase [Chryseobacterium sp. HMWF028]
MLSNFVPLASPDINETDINRVVDVLKSGMLVQGENVGLLENFFSDYLGAEHASALSNGTSTLHLALITLGIGPGDEVIVPAFSYVATANVVELVGAKCIFVDIDENTFNIDVNKIKEAITPNTKAIIPVHEFGLACDIESVMNIAKEHNLYVVEDAACALGATQNNKKVGTFGDFGSFSLHPRKSITSGEGGILTTNNADYSAKIRILRNHGIEMQDGKMEFVEAGYNYRMTDFQAALAHSQIQRLDHILTLKQTLADVYLSEIKNPKITLPVVPEGRNHTWQTFHVLIDDSLKQSEVLEFLRNNKIGANYGAQCIPAMKYYADKYKLDYKEKFPNAYRAYSKGVAVPLYEKLTEDTVYKISQILNTI